MCKSVGWLCLASDDRVYRICKIWTHWALLRKSSARKAACVRFYAHAIRNQAMITAIAVDASVAAAVCTILRSNKRQLTLKADWIFFSFLNAINTHRKKKLIRTFIGIYNDDFIWICWNCPVAKSTSRTLPRHGGN